MFRRVALVTLLGATSTGCFSFKEASGVRVGETARVIMAVSRPMADGTSQEIRLEGLVVSSSLAVVDHPAPSLSLERTNKQPVGNFREFVMVDTINVLQPDIGRLESKRFSWAKSGFGVVVLGALGYLAWDKFKPSFDNGGVLGR